MINIIPVDQFKTIPWKNGKGKTTELAISKNGSMDDFDWRLSIASVTEDGPFSDFSGYERNLILLEGLGIELVHDAVQIDILDKPLAISSFNGASKTQGKLIDGPIKDFNLMTKKSKYSVDINTFIEKSELKIETKGLCFVYSHQDKTTIQSKSKKAQIPIGHLTVIQDNSTVKIIGKMFILIQLTPKY